MEGHIGDTIVFGTSMASHAASMGTCARTASDHESSAKPSAEVLKPRRSATEVSPCLAGGAKEHTHSLFRNALQRDYSQRDLQGFKVVAMVKKLEIHMHSWLHSFILWLLSRSALVIRSMLVVTAPVQG